MADGHQCDRRLSRRRDNVNGWLACRAYRRDRNYERQVLAASLLSEITTLTSLMHELGFRDMFGNVLDDMLTRARAGEPWRASTDPITFPVTIYEKCADRLGVLDVETASGVVRYYNYLNGARTGLHWAIGAGGQRIQARTTIIQALIKILDCEVPKIPILMSRLEAIAAPDRK
jgi:hypothetical protein